MEQDTCTPERLDRIYEQIQRGTVVPNDHAWRMVHPVECHSEPASMIAMDLSVDYSVLEDQLHNLECELRDALALKYVEFANSQNCLRCRLEETRTSEEIL